MRTRFADQVEESGETERFPAVKEGLRDVGGRNEIIPLGDHDEEILFVSELVVLENPIERDHANTLGNQVDRYGEGETGTDSPFGSLPAVPTGESRRGWER